jgi:hypothetical protein
MGVRQTISKYHLFLISCLALLMILWLRRPDSITNAQFWAEDGFVLFHDRIVYGAVGSLHRIYAGYFTALPRLIASGAFILPLSLVPLAYSVSALVISAVCLAWFTLPQYRSLLPSDALRVVVCLLSSTAVYSAELVGVLINTQWLLFLPATLCLFSGARLISWRQKASRFLWGGLLGLTTPLLLILVPICIWRILRSRSLRFPFEIGLVAALVVQLIAFAVDARGSDAHSGALPTVSATAAATVYGIVLRTMLGHTTALDLKLGRNLAAVATVGIAGSAWVAWFWITSDQENRSRLLLGLYLAAASLGLAIAGRGLAEPFGTLADFRGWAAERYFFFPSCVLIFLIALSINKAAVRLRPAVAGLLIAALFFGGVVQNYRIHSFVDFHWRSYTKRIEAAIQELRDAQPAAVSVPINPAPWKIVIP